LVYPGCRLPFFQMPPVPPPPVPSSSFTKRPPVKVRTRVQSLIEVTLVRLRRYIGVFRPPMFPLYVMQLNFSRSFPLFSPYVHGFGKSLRRSMPRAPLSTSLPPSMALMLKNDFRCVLPGRLSPCVGTLPFSSFSSFSAVPPLCSGEMDERLPYPRAPVSPPYFSRLVSQF